MMKNDKLILCNHIGVSGYAGCKKKAGVNEPAIASTNHINRHALDSSLQRLPVVCDSLGESSFLP